MWGTLSLLGIGLVYGLKHATEVDHVVAVSTIVSRHRNVWRSALVGAMWGAGHTAALLITGVIVLVLRVAIPERVSNWLEFGVALMIIGLGAAALWRALAKSTDVHVHEHDHDGVSHVHIHFHENETRHQPAKTHNHAISTVGLKPVLIGTMHGLAGSGVLTLLVLTQIESAWVGFFYLLVFGLGSIVGMILMSGLIGLPFALTSRNVGRVHHHLQTMAAALSIAFGLWYAYRTALTSGLFQF
jgi:ABC-type nickel/cobalt efflux system permease component RcnA